MGVILTIDYHLPYSNAYGTTYGDDPDVEHINDDSDHDESEAIQIDSPLTSGLEPLNLRYNPARISR